MRTILDLKGSPNLHDLELNHSETLLAAGFEDGSVSVYQLRGPELVLLDSFQAESSPVWKVSWAPSKYGQVLAVASFRKHVSVWQRGKSGWEEIAEVSTHESSVNFLEFAAESFGLQLFACSSDGFISILEHSSAGWSLSKFQAHEMSINMIALEPESLLLESSQNKYPRVISCSRDKTVKIWTFDQEWICTQKIVPREENIKVVCWRKNYTDSFFTASEEGFVKEWFREEGGSFQESEVCSLGGVPWRMSNSLSGDIVQVQYGQGHKILRWEDDSWVEIQ